MTRSAAEWNQARPITTRLPAGPPADAACRSRQLTLIDVGDGGGSAQDVLDLAEQIVSLERELRYYRRLIPALTRATVRPPSPGREHPRDLTHLARWLTDGHRVIDSISQALVEQRQLDIRLGALERAHRQVRDEIAQLFGDESEERDAGVDALGSGWLRAGLVALILVIVAIVSVPYFIDWWRLVMEGRG
jgi:hypothetical protein